MASKSSPRTPKNLQKCCTLVVFLVFAIFGKIAPNHLGFQVGHLGHILAPSWPTWRHLGAKMRPNSHPNGAPDALQIASWASLAPRGSPRTSKVPLEPQFSTIFPLILIRIRLIFQAAFFNFQPQVRHGGGLARAAQWISAGPAKRRHGVLNLVSNPPSPSSLDLSKFKL